MTSFIDLLMTPPFPSLTVTLTAQKSAILQLTWWQPRLTKNLQERQREGGKKDNDKHEQKKNLKHQSFFLFLPFFAMVFTSAPFLLLLCLPGLKSAPLQADENSTDV